MEGLKEDFEHYMEKRGYIKAPVLNYVEVAATKSNSAPVMGHLEWEEVGCVGTAFNQINPRAKDIADSLLFHAVVPSDLIKDRLTYRVMFSNFTQTFLEKKQGDIGGFAISNHFQTGQPPTECYTTDYVGKGFKNEFISQKKERRAKK